MAAGGRSVAGYVRLDIPWNTVIDADDALGSADHISHQ
jgi:hypothetical protein